MTHLSLIRTDASAMTEQVFELENFRGPMDLLLHLIREQEMEILEVDLSRLCDQYLAALEVMKAVDINVAGEFLVMASTLILIKSRSILPREEEVDLEEELDPGDELIQQLLEYRKFKSLSLELGDRASETALRHPRGTSEVPPDPGTELEEIGLWDLVGSFVRLMEEIGINREFHTLTLEKPMSEYMRDTLKQLASRDQWPLRDFILQAGGTSDVLGVFLSLLELVKAQQVVVKQASEHEPITLALREDRDSEPLHLPQEDELSASDGAEEDEPRPPAQPLSDEDEAPASASDLAVSDADSIVSPFSPRVDETGGD
ncbi:MAG: segregation/condensation protein A [Planctomycetota bacterium]|nr:segregation/condensation protein A [Planctomycetota bacterium]